MLWMCWNIMGAGKVMISTCLWIICCNTKELELFSFQVCLYTACLLPTYQYFFTEQARIAETKAATTIFANLKENLYVTKNHEYYSGFFRGVLRAATKPNPVNHQVAANLLVVHRNSITNATTEYQSHSLND